MKTKKNKKAKDIRKILVIALFIISLVMTAGTFAYWVTNVEGTNSDSVGTIGIGSASGVSTEFILSNDSSTGGNLVPKGMNISSEQNAVEEIYLSYDLKWIEEAEVSQLEGTITKGNISISHSLDIFKDGVLLDHDEYQNIYDLIVVTYSENNPETLTLDGDSETFSFTITMEEPADKEEYLLIVDSDIQITITYEIKDQYIETVDDEVVEEDNTTTEDNRTTEEDTNNQVETRPYYDYYVQGGYWRIYTDDWTYEFFSTN